MSALPVNCREARASLDFIKETERYELEKPYYYSGPLEPSDKESRSNIEIERHHNIPIFDLRQQLDDFKLVDSGFELIHLPNSTFMGDKDDGTKTYIHEVKSYLKR